MHQYDYTLVENADGTLGVEVRDTADHADAMTLNGDPSYNED